MLIKGDSNVKNENQHMNTPTYTKYPKPFSKKIMLQKDISQNTSKFITIMAVGWIHNERCMKGAVEFDINYFLVEKKDGGY